MLANGCRSPKYLLLRKPNIWPRKHSSCCFSVSSCSLSIDVDNIIVSSQFLLEVIFSPSSSILKWCSINADSSSRLLLFFFFRRAAGRPSISFCLAPPGANRFRRAAERPSSSSFVAPPGDHQLLSASRRRAPRFRRAAERPSSSSFVTPPGRRATINFFPPRAAGRQSISPGRRATINFLLPRAARRQ